MSGEGDSAPHGDGDRTHPGRATMGLDSEVAQHTYNLRPKSRAVHAATPKGATAHSVVVPGEGEEANHRRVGGRNARTEADVDEGGNVTDVSGEDLSDDQSVRYALRSEASDDWQESKSRVTTPESSTPSSPRRRTRVEEPVSRQRPDLTWSAPPGARMHPQGEKVQAAQVPRQSSLPLPEIEDPAELEARSTQLIAQL